MVGTLLQTLAGADFEQVLTSAARAIHLNEFEVNSRTLDLKTPEAWSVRKVTLHGGKQEGVDLIVVDNGKLRFEVIPTRGLGILRAQLGDVRLGWDSPVKEVVHPQFVNLESRGGLGWLEGFNEWIVRCGLEFAGHPGKDKFINNVGDEAEMDLTLHGKIGNIPASEVIVAIESGPPHRIHLRGRVDERMFYGPKLELWTDISTEPGSNALRIEDTVVNRGAYDQEFEIIYHANYGPPILEKGAQFLGAVKKVTPFNARAAEGIQGFQTYEAPTKGFIEQVYCIDPHIGPGGKTVVGLRNAAGSRAVSMQFSPEQLPYLTLWKNTTALEEGYVTGLEPGTNFPFNRRIERKAGRLQKLPAGQSRKFEIEIGIYADAPSVKSLEERIHAISAGRPTQVDTEPVSR